MEEVAIYGFGSFFNNKNESNDIDLLILHQNISYESCQFSIWCKKYIAANISGADITILSRLEEHQFSFIEKSKAKYLGSVHEKTAKHDLDLILAKEIGNNALNTSL